MNLRRHFLCLAALVGLSMIAPKPSQAADLYFPDWAVTIEETAPRSFPYGTVMGGWGSWWAGPYGTFQLGGGGAGVSVQGLGGIYGSSQGYRHSSAYYGEQIVTRVTFTRMAAIHSDRPSSLHVLSNNSNALSLPNVLSTECVGWSSWLVKYNGSTVMSEFKNKIYQYPIATIATTGTGNGNVYLAPSLTSGTVGQVGEKIIFDGVTFINDANFSTGRSNPYSSLTSSAMVIAQYSLIISQIPPQGWSAIPL
jgi:hypothetical protein